MKQTADDHQVQAGASKVRAVDTNGVARECTAVIYSAIAVVSSSRSKVGRGLQTTPGAGSKDLPYETFVKTRLDKVAKIIEYFLRNSSLTPLV